MPHASNLDVLSLHLQHTRKVGLVSYPERGIGGINLPIGSRVKWGATKNGLRSASPSGFAALVAIGENFGDAGD
jgi:hypothetical protein